MGSTFWEVVFWGSFVLIGYVYFGYPVVLALLSKIRRKKVKGDDGYLPAVTVVIAAYNEEKSIGAKIEDTLAQDYPKERLEIIVASDCSNDRTDDIVRSFSRQGVILNRQSQRLGKTSAQNDSARKASGEIIVFSDATTMYEKTAIRNLVRNFRDDSIGCVGGELTYVNPSGKLVGEGGGLYWRYERWLRDMEGAVCSLIGVSGCMYAVRKSLYRDIPPDLISDFVIAGVIYEQGYRTIFEREARCFEETTDTSEDEFRMRVRVVVRSLRGLWAKRSLLNPFRYGFFAVQLLSHKVLRYLVPLFMLALFGASWLLRADTVCLVFFVLQLLFYGGAILGYYLQEKRQRKSIFYIPYYFVLVNVAALKGLLKFVGGERQTVWEPLRK